MAWVALKAGAHNTTLKICDGVPTWVVANCPGFVIGDTGPAGGKVFYVDATGAHGLEAAPVDQTNDSGLATWGCLGTSIPGTSTAVGTGAANTTLIIAGCAEANTAAKVAHAYSLNGYTDWYLPSKDELALLYEQKTVVGAFANDYYWSSTEFGVRYEVWNQHFGYGYQPACSKDAMIPVRAIRTF